MEKILILVGMLAGGWIIWGFIRKVADPTGGRWLDGYKNSTWTEIGELTLNKTYASVFFSEESCMGFSNTGSVSILKTMNESTFETIFFAVIFKYSDDYNNPNTIRIMNIRSVDMIGNYLDEQFVSAKYTKFDGIDIPFNELPNLSKKILDKIKRLSKKNGMTYVAQDDKWLNKTFVD